MLVKIYTRCPKCNAESVDVEDEVRMADVKCHRYAQRTVYLYLCDECQIAKAAPGQRQFVRDCLARARSAKHVRFAKQQSTGGGHASEDGRSASDARRPAKETE